jgi:hypothetical protein
MTSFILFVPGLHDVFSSFSLFTEAQPQPPTSSTCLPYKKSPTMESKVGCSNPTTRTHVSNSQNQSLLEIIGNLSQNKNQKYIEELNTFISALISVCSS